MRQRSTPTIDNMNSILKPKQQQQYSAFKISIRIGFMYGCQAINKLHVFTNY